MPTTRYNKILPSILMISILTASMFLAAGSLPASAQKKNPNATIEDQYWDAVKNSTKVEDFESYLKEFPNGKYAESARLKLNQQLRQPANRSDTKTRSNYLITLISAGDIRIGMTIAKARKIFSGAKFEQYNSGEEGTNIYITRGEKSLMRLTTNQKNLNNYGEGPVPIDESAKIESIVIEDSRYKTADGVYPGIAIREAEKSFGKIKKITLYEYDGSEHAEFHNAPENYSFVVSAKTGANDEDRAGIYEKDEYTTADYAKDAVLSAITISNHERTDAANNTLNYLITASSAGDIRIGMTVAAARKALTGAKFTLGSGCEDMPEITVRRDDKVIMKLVVPELENSVIENAEIGNIVIYDSRYRTAEGLRTGMPLTEVEKKHGKFELWFGDLRYCPGEAGTFTAKSPYTFQAEAKNGNAGIYNESRITTKYNPNAYISAIRLSGVR